MEVLRQGSGTLTQKRTFALVNLLLWVNILICLIRAIPTRKRCVKAPGINEETLMS